MKTTDTTALGIGMVERPAVATPNAEGNYRATFRNDEGATLAIFEFQATDDAAAIEQADGIDLDDEGQASRIELDQVESVGTWRPVHDWAYRSAAPIIGA